MRKEWTESEIFYLKSRYLLQPVKTTAEKLNRSEPSVKQKAKRLGLSHYNDSLNAKTVAACFNSDHSVVLRWIKKFNLPCKKVKCGNQTRYIIDQEKFWKWAEQNKGIINWSKYDQRSLCPEPSWLKDEIKSYATKNSRKKYTEEEKRRIRVMLRKGYTYEEIAREVNRSYWGIKNLCRNIF